jgi:hypothetical protein
MTTSKRTSRRTPGAQAVDGTDAPSSKPRTRRTKSSTATAHHPEDRHASIAKAAYFRSQHRGFIPGYELEDWLAAEQEIDRRGLDVAG